MLNFKRTIPLATLLAIGGLMTPIGVQSAVAQDVTRDADDDDFDNWGLLGLLGLAGLLGRRRTDRDVADTRRL